MSMITYEQDGEIKRTSGSFFRGENTNFHPSDQTFSNADFLSKYVMKGWAPPSSFVTKETPIVAFGSCFAANISDYLHARGYNVLTKHENRAYVTQMGDGIVNTFAILQQFEWAWLNKTPSADLWHGYRAEEFGYDDDVRRDTKALFDAAELFVITLGLSEIWYDELTGEVFWRAVPRDRYDPSRHKFRVATHAETLANLHRIHALIREYRPEAHILFSVSPVPLTATFRPVSCITADAVSKATLRSALDEFLGVHSSDQRLHYMPSYEAVTRLFSHQWEGDRRHPHIHVLDFNMQMFEAFFCKPGLPMPTLEATFRAALETDVKLGMEGHENEGMSYSQLRNLRIEERREAKREARRQERIMERAALRNRLKQEQQRAESNLPKQDRKRAKITLVSTLLLKAAVALLALQGVWSLADDWLMAAVLAL
ncbi:GSCFA family protein [Neorhizobium alkalisoli]|uniref:GSCFA family protein n=2 Tax=Neorhizobium alkalisoli TaxID=528178 RepID=A0A561QHN8_9HYPH|nr:GSCFA family protein [Neorhizobium alkalisoli]